MPRTDLLCLVVGVYSWRWEETDTKHIEPYWGQISRDECALVVYVKGPGKKHWKRVTKINEIEQALKDEAEALDCYWRDDVEFRVPPNQSEFPCIVCQNENWGNILSKYQFNLNQI